MKRTYILITAFVLFFTSCTKDEQIDLLGDQTQCLTFSITGANGNLATYSGVTVPGNGFEKIIHNISVYLFDYTTDGSGLLRVVADFDHLSMSDNKVILNVDVDIALTGQYVAYFIANNANAQFIDLTNPYNNGIGVTVGSTTEKWFQNMPTKSFQNIPTESFLITGNISAPFPAYGDHEVMLRNRVARFDVVNKHPNLTITKITIHDATDRNTVFGDATQDPEAQFIDPDEVTTFSWEDYEINGEVVGVTSESVFFLHPTDIPTDTKIYIEGYTGTLDVDDKTFVYEVDSDPINILANYRYLLNVTNDAPITIELAEEWDVDENAVVANTHALQLITRITGTTLLNETSYTMELFGSTRIRLLTANPAGVSYEFIPIKGDPNFFAEYSTPNFNILENTTTQTISYSSPYYTTNFRFSFSAPADKKSFVSILRFTDGGSEKIDIIIYYRREETFPDDIYPGSTLTGVTVGGVTWAPVNVGTVSPDEPGIYAQWNRQRGFLGGVTTNVVNGPLAYREFNHSYEYSSSLYQQPFIANRTNDGTGDWLETDDPYFDARHSLWNVSGLNPCPDGWGIPTAIQFQTLIDAYETQTYSSNGTSITFEGDDGISSLTLPYAGYLDYTNGKRYSNNNMGRYWSMSYNTNHSNALSLGSGVSIDTYPRAMGYSLRCVKQ